MAQSLTLALGGHEKQATTRFLTVVVCFGSVAASRQGQQSANSCLSWPLHITDCGYYVVYISPGGRVSSFQAWNRCGTDLIQLTELVGERPSRKGCKKLEEIIAAVVLAGDVSLTSAVLASPAGSTAAHIGAGEETSCAAISGNKKETSPSHCRSGL